MGKINKEELLEKLGGIPLSDDELEQVSGGVETFRFAFRLGPHGERIPVTGQETQNIPHESDGDATYI